MDQRVYLEHLAFCRRNVAVSLYRPMWDLAKAPGVPMLSPYPPGPVGPVPMRPCPSESHPEVDQSHLEVLRFQQRRALSDLTWEQSLSKSMVAAIRKWVGIVLVHPQSFDLGRRVSRSLPLGVALHEGLRDVFAGKASGTLHNRAGPMLRFIAYCNSLGIPPFPVEERHAYSFAKSLEGKCSATFLRSFVVTMCFCHHLLGLSGSAEVASSMRVKGVAQGMFLTKRKTVQKPPFTVKMVAALERFVCKASSSRDASRLVEAVAAGFFLVCIYMRARYSDGLHLRDLVVDKPVGRPGLCGYVEGVASRSKTSFTVERKTMLLPMVMPRHGVAGVDWFEAWQQCRTKTKVPSGEGIPLLPAPYGMGWLRTPLRAAAAADWVKEILGRLGFTPQEVGAIGTHSAKATCLSWCAKRNISLESRRLLGYHSRADERVPLVYSRDSVAGPVRDLEGVIKEIFDGSFRPDSTRSGYLEAHDADVANRESDSEDSLDEEDDAADQRAVEQALEHVVDPWHERGGVEGGHDAPVFRHPSTRIIHAVAGEEGSRFRCGRVVRPSYERLGELPRFAYPLCKTCYPSRA